MTVSTYLGLFCYLLLLLCTFLVKANIGKYPDTRIPRYFQQSKIPYPGYIIYITLFMITLFMNKGILYINHDYVGFLCRVSDVTFVKP